MGAGTMGSRSVTEVEGVVKIVGMIVAQACATILRDLIVRPMTSGYERQD